MSENLSYEKLMALIQAAHEAAQVDREAAQVEREAERAARETERAERKAAQAAREADRERSDREYERAQAEIQKIRKDIRKHWRETGHRMKASSAETERSMKASSAETDRCIKASLADMARVVKNVSRQLGGIGNSNGAMAENYFYNSFKKTKKFGHETFEYVDRNLKFGTRDLQDKYDIVLFNGQSIGIIEVEYDAEKKHIAQTINKATTFRQNEHLWLGDWYLFCNQLAPRRGQC